MTYDAVVIGSGFGGAIVACRLAESGRSVVVLEKGRRWDKDDFPRTIGQVSQAFWEPGKSHGFLEYKAFRRLDVIQGVGVGGGSLHYFNVHIRTPAEIFRQGWPTEVSRETLEPYYDLAQAMMESRPLTPPAGRDQLPHRTRVFMDAARAANYETEQVDIAVFTGEDRIHPLGGNTQSACTYCGNCIFGCHLHAKNTLDFTYLGLAERRYGAEIRPLHTATGIVPLEDGTYKVEFERRASDPSIPPEKGSVKARRVVVSAGSLGTAQLLLKCRDEAKTLPKLSSALGKKFSVNGEFVLAGARDTRKPVDPGWGPPITAKATVRSGNHLLTIEDLGLPDSFFWFVEGADAHARQPPAPTVGRPGDLFADHSGSGRSQSLEPGGRQDRLGWQDESFYALSRYGKRCSQRDDAPFEGRVGHSLEPWAES